MSMRFLLYFFKLSAGNGFWSVIPIHDSKFCIFTTFLRRVNISTTKFNATTRLNLCDYKLSNIVRGKFMLKTCIP